MSSKRNLSSDEALEHPPNKRQRLCSDENKEDPMIQPYDFDTESDSEPDGTQSICMLHIV